MFCSNKKENKFQRNAFEKKKIRKTLHSQFSSWENKKKSKKNHCWGVERMLEA